MARTPEAEIFLKKLEAFSVMLTDHERAALTAMLERGGLSDKELGKVRGGTGSVQAQAMTANFFSRFMLSW